MKKLIFLLIGFPAFLFVGNECPVGEYVGVYVAQDLPEGIEIVWTVSSTECSSRYQGHGSKLGTVDIEICVTHPDIPTLCFNVSGNATDDCLILADGKHVKGIYAAGGFSGKSKDTDEDGVYDEITGFGCLCIMDKRTNQKMFCMPEYVTLLLTA